jgi:AraC family transcriptional regulator, transcriptional activator of the genes for pyochelin and ferripyochelin receptors
MRILQEEELEEICSSSQQAGEVPYEETDFEIKAGLPPEFGYGTEHLIRLRHGLSIQMIQGSLSQELTLEKQHDMAFPLTAKFYLAGGSRILSPGCTEVKTEYEEYCGHHYLYCLPEMQEFEQYEAEKPFSILYICWELEYIRSFQQEWSEISTALQQVIQGTSRKRFHQSLGKMPQNVQTTVQQIFHCPYSGVVKQVYLESKALEIFAIQLSHYQNARQSEQSSVLRATDIQRLHQARELLQRQFDTPPSIAALAQQVGLNRRKLTEGFRQLFGTTPFGCLRDYRLEQARSLLIDSEESVEFVMRQVGYCDRSHFATAFRKKFGVNPKTYQLQRQHQNISI